jgi:hypothetical protein
MVLESCKRMTNLSYDDAKAEVISYLDCSDNAAQFVLSVAISAKVAYSGDMTVISRSPVNFTIIIPE